MARNRMTYLGRGSNVEREAEETHAKGGGRRKRKIGGKVPGFKSGGRADRKPRGAEHHYLAKLSSDITGGAGAATGVGRVTEHEHYRRKQDRSHFRRGGVVKYEDPDPVDAFAPETRRREGHLGESQDHPLDGPYSWTADESEARRALRSVGDRLLNVACAMLRNGTQFNPSLESQKKVLAKG